MAGKVWKGQEATLSIEKNSTSYPIGGLQNVEYETEKNIEEKFGAGSIKRLDIQQTELRVNVTADVASWDLAGWQALTGYDTTNAEIEDTPTPPTFTVSGTIEAADGTELSITVENCYAENVPIGGGKDEWMELELNLTGGDITQLEETTA